MLFGSWKNSKYNEFDFLEAKKAEKTMNLILSNPNKFKTMNLIFWKLKDLKNNDFNFLEAE